MHLLIGSAGRALRVTRRYDGWAAALRRTVGVVADDESLPRPLVTITGGPVDLHQADVLGVEAGPRRGLRETAVGVLRWQPRRDLLVPLTAAASVVLLAGAVSAIALELRPVSTVPADVVAATLAAGSYRVELRADETEGDASPDRAVLDVDLGEEAFRFEVATTSASGQGVSFGVVTIGGDTWTRFPSAEALARDELGAEPSEEAVWLRSDTDAEQSGQLLGTEAGLRDLLGDARVVRELPDGLVGDDEVRRVVVALTDPDSGSGSASSDALAERDEVEAQMSVDDEGRLRQLVIEDTDGGAAVRSTLELSRFGDDLGIEPPPADQVREGGDGLFGT